MDGYSLTDTQWDRDPAALSGEEVRSGPDRWRYAAVPGGHSMDCANREPWRDLPKHFGHWKTVFKRFRHWVKADVFKRIFDALSDDPDMEYAMVDATIVKVHRHGQGAKGGLKARP